MNKLLITLGLIVSFGMPMSIAGAQTMDDTKWGTARNYTFDQKDEMLRILSDKKAAIDKKIAGIKDTQDSDDVKKLNVVMQNDKKREIDNLISRIKKANETDWDQVRNWVADEAMRLDTNM